MAETVFYKLLEDIAAAFQKKGDKATLKDVLDDTEGYRQAIRQDVGGKFLGQSPDTGGSDYLPRGGYEPASEPNTGGSDYLPQSTYQPPERQRTPIQRPMPIQQDFGKEYAPDSPYGSPEQRGQLRKDYEQNAFGLDGLREQFMNEGMPPNIGPQMPGYERQLSNTNNTDNMITMLNASLSKRRNYRQDYGR
jgi:hypothetical protein